ncbi:nucleotide sugar dehydrogenase [Helicobacter cetorum]|uniref:nucleotide sugar dehydrogenase n=1 Tax=Helicobacter cetorum TaxID=138563 RepID=UPI000CF193BB|nr:nucleotide sugar dehydrogenase [Helicobacter cetorum]
MKDLKECQIAVIGLGYVGLPLILALGEHFKCVGFDISKKRIEELQNAKDSNNEMQMQDFRQSIHCSFTDKESDLKSTDIFIIAVPTPIDEAKKPDISMLLKASNLVGRHLKKGNIVIYESTTYPTCTETKCVKELEKASKLIYNKDFFVGYSPERINVGDKEHTLKNTIKITSASTKESAILVNKLYSTITQTYLAPSIVVAESAKAIENAQRDLNIAFLNEIACLLDKLEVDIYEVLKACQTKWNFLPFTPGLVGGHCIGIDPYYLTHIAKIYQSPLQLLEKAREINENTPKFVAHKCAKLLAKNNIAIFKARILILGASFKENCNDIRNTPITKLKHELEQLGACVSVYDPLVKTNAFELLDKLPTTPTYEGVIVAIKHEVFKTLNILDLLLENGILYDLKDFISKNHTINKNYFTF